VFALVRTGLWLVELRGFEPLTFSLAPGRTLEWILGAAHNSVDWDMNNEYKVRLEADGPFGPLEPLEYVIVVSNLKGSHPTPTGNLHAVAKELHEIGKATNQLRWSIMQLQPPPVDQPIESSIPVRPPIESSIPMEPLSGENS
jgi:hypothetical protein